MTIKMIDKFAFNLIKIENFPLSKAAIKWMKSKTDLKKKFPIYYLTRDSKPKMDVEGVCVRVCKITKKMNLI